MASNTTDSNISPEVRSILARLRWQIRAYVWMEGLALAVIWLGLTFWLGLAIDYLPVLAGASEMPVAARAVLLALIAGVLVLILYRWVLRRTFVRLADHSMAVLLERRYGQFHDSLVTSVEMSEHPDHASDFNAEMLRRTSEEARSQLGQINLRQIFDYSPLAWKLAAAVLLVVPIGVLYAVNAQAVELWINRIYLLQDQPWPRQARIEVVGIELQRDTTEVPGMPGSYVMPFDEGRVKVARGASVNILVRADASKEKIPDVCTIHYRTEQGDRGRVPMQKVGRVRDGYQPYTFEGKPFKGILSNIQFDVVGYDHRVSNYRVDVVESPTVVATTLDVVFPSYLVDPELASWMPRNDMPWTPGTQLPRGAELTLQFQTNKDLKEVQIRDAADGEVTVLQMSPGEPAQTFDYHVPQLGENLTLDVTLHDVDDVISQQPHRVFIAAIEDEPPQVNVVLQGIREAITPDALVPVRGSIRDDYQIDDSWVQVQVNETEPRRLNFALESEGQVQTQVDFRELRSGESAFELKPKDRLALLVQATDKYDLDGETHVGSGDRITLNVVTPDELLVMLERRELALRHRFEQIIDEVEQMRQSLTHVRADLNGDEVGTEPPAGNGAEPAGVTERVPDEQRSASLRRLRVQRALLQSEKSSQEILGVAASFRDIREELINNRVDTEDRKSRLKQQIADPLEQVVSSMFPELEKRLEALQEQLDAEQPAAADVDPAIDQASDILVQLNEVLQRMLDLETYNELIDIVRSLIDDQQQLMEQTKEQRKKQVLDLFQ